MDINNNSACGTVENFLFFFSFEPEVISFIHHVTFESSLEEVAVTTVTAIEIHGVCSKQPSHQLRKRGTLPAFYKEMEMEVIKTVRDINSFRTSHG